MWIMAQEFLTSSDRFNCLELNARLGVTKGNVRLRCTIICNTIIHAAGNKTRPVENLLEWCSRLIQIRIKTVTPTLLLFKVTHCSPFSYCHIMRLDQRVCKHRSPLSIVSLVHPVLCDLNCETIPLGADSKSWPSPQRRNTASLFDPPPLL